MKKRRFRREDVMKGTRQKAGKLELPGLRPGTWRGEIVGGCTVNFGHVVQDGPPRRAVEFSYIIMPAAFTKREGGFTWPGVVALFAPTPIKPETTDAGCLLQSKELPALTLSLNVTREQFSDMARLLEAKRLKEFHFTIEDGADGSWPVHSWGMTLRA
jgi:hypothetical protein